MKKTLIPESLPLTGSHLIEASAGTGKTYNITRIYLRLLLQQELDVKNILVMTFTRAATEELRGRIAKEIRYTMDHWGNFDIQDSFFTALQNEIAIDKAYAILHNALIHLDEAAIFTIHSFCNRVLSQYAFASGIDFNVQMEADTVDIELEAVRDWYRFLAKQNLGGFLSEAFHDYQLLTQKWPSPESFQQAFKELFSANYPVQFNTAESVLANFQQQKKHLLDTLQANQEFVFSQLIDPHKDKQIRSEEWQILMHWLHTNDLQIMPKEAASVFNGVRYARKESTIKQTLNDLFEPLKAIKKESVDIEQKINKTYAYQLAAQGIDIIRKKISQAKRNAKVMNYDDLIYQLDHALKSEDSLAQLILERYPVALVDEFQDTDAQQYAILKAIYHSKPIAQEETDKNAFYMIGDPKQAIYAFRGGDVFTYLKARSDVDQQWLMDTNWRSSSAMVNAYNRLFYGASINETAQDTFGFNIHYSPVKPSEKADKTPLSNASEELEAALQFIYFPFNEDYRVKRVRADYNSQEFCPLMANWCSAEIHRLLTTESKIGDQPLREQDIAVLVRDKKEAAYIQDALRLSGYASVYLSTHDNVFLSTEASELQEVLNGILYLEDDRLLMVALATRYMGCNSEDLFAIKTDEVKWEKYKDEISVLRDHWLKRGFMAMALKLLHHFFHPEASSHERSLTNAIQLLELLQQASQQYKQPEQLLHWLGEQINNKSAMAAAELRLESDADLIRIITMHGCKGLEYPIVFIPFASRHKEPAKFGNKNNDLFKYHSGEEQQLHYFIGQDPQITRRYEEEMYAETIRLLYVAVTRAEHRCYVCVTPFTKSHLSPLGHTLKLAINDDWQQSLQQLVASEPESIALGCIEDPVSVVIRDSVPQEKELYSPAVFTGRIEHNWWLSSFSALTRNLHHDGLSSPDRDQDKIENVTAELETLALRFSLTKGAAAGNLLHDILEHCHFMKPQWQQIMERPLSRFNETLDETQNNELIDWLSDCLNTPLKGQGSPKLNELLWGDTLRESEFYFPMEHVKMKSLGDLLARHRQQRNAWTELPVVSLQLDNNRLEGMMHGFIDLIFQWQGKYYVADYKSTHLGQQLSDYQHNSLDQNIQDNYYDLQYLLYSLALHRYLQSRLTDYDIEQHFGGVYYLYLRGMSAASDTGVFNTHISAALLTELDALFSGTASQELLHV